MIDSLRSAHATLRGYLTTYREAVASFGYRAIADLQPAPFASVTYGGGGTAYVLWRLGMSRRAAAWLRSSLADRRRGAFALPNMAPRGDSYSHGRGGLLWLRNLIATRPTPQNISAYAHAIARADKPEFMSGRAGHLTGIRLLLARRSHPRLHAIADELAESLSDAVRRRAREPWQATDAIGFAHHWPGTIYALLAWHRSTSQPLPPWLGDAIRDLHRVWTPGTRRGTTLASSWCNGAAGTALLWVKAYDAIGDDRYRVAAAAAADQALRANDGGFSLCCGLTGIAFALLELDRIDRTRDWRGVATELAVQAIECAAPRWPNGLFQGHPGLVCLVLDLLADKPAGFPTLEA
jgi:hypothetical protein